MSGTKPLNHQHYYHSIYNINGHIYFSTITFIYTIYYLLFFFTYVIKKSKWFSGLEWLIVRKSGGLVGGL